MKKNIRLKFIELCLIEFVFLYDYEKINVFFCLKIIFFLFGKFFYLLDYYGVDIYIGN